jgi:hypothetical protein
MNENIVTFYVDHYSSDSRAEVDFALVKNKAKVQGVRFLKGNVVSWVHLRKAQQAATIVLGAIPEEPTKPPTG